MSCLSHGRVSQTQRWEKGTRHNTPRGIPLEKWHMIIYAVSQEGWLLGTTMSEGGTGASRNRVLCFLI